MKIVIISDLHGNYDALSSLRETGDELWVLGDLVNYGPQPQEVVEYMRRHANLVMRGNHDNAVGFQADPRCTPRYREMALTTMQYSSARLDSSDKEYLRRLPLTVTVQCDGRNFFLCHAVPSEAGAILSKHFSQTKLAIHDRLHACESKDDLACRNISRALRALIRQPEHSRGDAA